MLVYSKSNNEVLIGQKLMSGKKIFNQLVTMVTIAIAPKLIGSLFTLDARKQF